VGRGDRMRVHAGLRAHEPVPPLEVRKRLRSGHLRSGRLAHEPIRGASRVADQALSLVGPGASVVAQVPVLPHLRHRREIHLLRRGAPDADFVVAAAHLDAWPNASRDGINALVEERRRRGYVVLFESDGWIVLRAPQPPPRPRDRPGLGG
jgi:hypothetical protein